MGKKNELEIYGEYLCFLPTIKLLSCKNIVYCILYNLRSQKRIGRQGEKADKLSFHDNLHKVFTENKLRVNNKHITYRK